MKLKFSSALFLIWKWIIIIKKVDFVDSGGSKNNKDDYDSKSGLVNEGIVGGVVEELCINNNNNNFI